MKFCVQCNKGILSLNALGRLQSFLKNKNFSPKKNDTKIQKGISLISIHYLIHLISQLRISCLLLK